MAHGLQHGAVAEELLGPQQKLQIKQQQGVVLPHARAVVVAVERPDVLVVGHDRLALDVALERDPPVDDVPVALVLHDERAQHGPQHGKDADVLDEARDVLIPPGGAELPAVLVPGLHDAGLVVGQEEGLDGAPLVLVPLRVPRGPEPEHELAHPPHGKVVQLRQARRHGRDEPPDVGGVPAVGALEQRGVERGGVLLPDLHGRVDELQHVEEVEAREVHPLPVGAQQEEQVEAVAGEQVQHAVVDVRALGGVALGEGLAPLQPDRDQVEDHEAEGHKHLARGGVRAAVVEPRRLEIEQAALQVVADHGAEGVGLIVLHGAVGAHPQVALRLAVRVHGLLGDQPLDAHPADARAAVHDVVAVAAAGVDQVQVDLARGAVAREPEHEGQQRLQRQRDGGGVPPGPVFGRGVLLAGKEHGIGVVEGVEVHAARASRLQRKGSSVHRRPLDARPGEADRRVPLRVRDHVGHLYEAGKLAAGDQVGLQREKLRVDQVDAHALAVDEHDIPRQQRRAARHAAAEIAHPAGRCHGERQRTRRV